MTGYERDKFEVYHRLYDVLNLTVISDKDTVGFTIWEPMPRYMTGRNKTVCRKYSFFARRSGMKEKIGQITLDDKHYPRKGFFTVTVR